MSFRKSIAYTLIIALLLSLTVFIPPVAASDADTVINLGSGFSWPRGVGVDSSGYIYVSDFVNHQMKRMDPDGSNLTILGPAFNWLDDIVPDNSGRLYFLESNFVKRMNADGTSITILGPRFDLPMGMTLDSSGNIYVADAVSKSLVRMDANGNNLTTLATGFDTICGVAVDSSGYIYIVDCWDDQIEKLDSDGNHMAFLGSGFSGSEGIALDSAGNIYVAQTAISSIMRMSADGSSIVTLGYGFRSPTNLAVDSSGNVFVADYGNHAIKKISPTPAYDAMCSADSAQPDVGAANQITLTVRNSFGDTDNSFNGFHDVTISGYAAAPNGTFGSFDSTPLEENSTTVSLNFAGGTASASLILNKASSQTIEFSIADVANAGSINLTPQMITSAPAITPIEGDRHVELSWEPSVNAESYSIYQSLDSGSYDSPLDTVASSVCSYDATGLTNGTTYYFTVHALDVYGNAAPSSEVSAMPWVPVTEAPILTGRAGNMSVALSWNEVPNAESYSVYCSEASGSYGSPVTTVGSAVHAFTVTDLANNQQYYFKVSASSFKNSLDSNEITATPQGRGDEYINPTVTTGQADSISDTSAQLHGAIQSGTVRIKEYGFMYGSSQLNMDKKIIVDTTDHQGDFQYIVSGLIPQTTYCLQAYALTEKNQWILGSVISFATEDSEQKQPPQPQPQPNKPNQPTPPITPLTQVFGDLPESYWASASINKLCGLGIVNGYPDGTFRPDSNITRAEFVSILVKAMDLEAENNGESFEDIPGHWAENDMITAASLGIISGFDNSSFRPDDPITREQLAVIAAKAAGLQTIAGDTNFADNDKISSWAKASVLAAVSANLLKGYPADNTFRPQNNTTRAEAVSLMVGLME